MSDTNIYRHVQTGEIVRGFIMKYTGSSGKCNWGTGWRVPFFVYWRESSKSWYPDALQPWEPWELQPWEPWEPTGEKDV